jgi:putative oxidoreductase
MSVTLTRSPGVGLALLRVTVGIVMVAHGYQKFFQYGLGGVTSAFTQMGVPLPEIAAPMVAIIELVGGALLVIGLFHRVAAALFAGVMVGAILFAKLSGGFFAPAGIEFELILGVAALCIALAGGGTLTADSMIGSRSSDD